MRCYRRRCFQIDFLTNASWPLIRTATSHRIDASSELSQKISHRERSRTLDPERQTRTLYLAGHANIHRNKNACYDDKGLAFYGCAPRCFRNEFFHCRNSTSICGRQSPCHRRGSLPRFEELPSTLQGTRNIFHCCLPSCADGGDRSQKAAMRWNELRRVRKVLQAGIIAPSSSGGKVRAG